uniref:Uncharacterized protein n=1 Tax=Eutreptiella gymnastica TaxID=73025 RepID=A0A7S4CT30_9EUGL|eukprot:CAMPEP_0174351686 /NCGR_PEP_ID=MMETSP0811_2-20130205/9103_1 /TAXON_ID=73025 ORGANISM="Eutreptiella gymnastica-like, Strain CCMP1594" /NCGR_SAMPLE_ID=MMETSP0811_2 /ASSEMBLY_ACC=CAM_ASM_000667 /LENGTH=143 /DNA_ID=CAMNT_0015481119 /DNA_START=82 /DNA_END=513 /DNA_ORIENTATION=+
MTSCSYKTATRPLYAIERALLKGSIRYGAAALMGGVTVSQTRQEARRALVLGVGGDECDDCGTTGTAASHQCIISSARAPGRALSGHASSPAAHTQPLPLTSHAPRATPLAPTRTQPSTSGAPCPAVQVSQHQNASCNAGGGP